MRMASKTEQLVALGNDVTVLETLFANKEGNSVVYPAHLMPDGKPFRVDLSGVKEMTGELRKQLVETVRGQWYAREDELNAAEIRNAAARTPAAGGADTDAPNGTGGASAAGPAVQELEESLEKTLTRRAELCRQRREAARENLERAQAEYDRAVMEANVAGALVQCMIDLQKDSLDKSDDVSSQKAKPQRGNTSSGGPKDGRRMMPSKS